MSNQLTKTKSDLEKQKQTSSKMADLLAKEKDAIVVPQVGELIEGIVVSIGKNEVLLDVDGIHTGVVRGKEILDESGDTSNLKIDDKIAATVLELDNENGELELSFRFAGHQKAWENLESLQESGEVVEAKIMDANKGGLMVKVGNVVGFLPVSQLTTEHYPRVEGGDRNKILTHLKSFTGETFKVKIIDINESEEKLIVSEKAAWEEKQQTAISKYKIGDTVKGTITGVVDFGAFVEFGDNLEGLIHISELAWQRIDDPRDIIHVGDKVEAAIIAIENSKISLSMKKLQQDPWAEVAKKYKVGQSVQGKVLKVNPFGAFVELDNDIHGLAHISELSTKEISSPADIVEIGETYKFNIISIEPANHRLGLSLINKTTKEESKETEKKKEKSKENKPANDSSDTPPSSTSLEEQAKKKEKEAKESSSAEATEDKATKEEPAPTSDKDKQAEKPETEDKE